MKNKKVFALALIFALFGAFLGSKVFAAGEAKYTTNVQGKARTYLVYQPQVCKTKACPVLFMFHGLNSTAVATTSSYYNWQSTADKNGFLVIYPESLTLPAKDVKWGRWIIYRNYDPAGKHWDIANISLPLAQRYNTQDIKFVNKIISELGVKYQIQQNKIFATGHSYGAFFSYYAATCLPTKIRAFASHSGGFISYYGFSFPISSRNAKASPYYKTPGMVLSSPKDPAVPHRYSLNLINELKAKYQTNQLVKLADNLGHNWDATKNQAQWNFFLANSK